MSYINMFLSTEPVGGFMGFMTKYGGTILLVVAVIVIFYFFLFLLAIIYTTAIIPINDTNIATENETIR